MSDYTHYTLYTPDTQTVREQYTREEPPHIGTVSSRRAEFDRWYADEIRKAKAQARAEALTKARVFLDRIAPNGLISKSHVLGDLSEWAERATRGIQPNGNPYTEES